MMNYKNGFTLIEVLFVLSVWSVILILSAPLHFSILEKQKEANFMKTLEMDLLYMQSKSYNSRSYFRLTFTGNESYFIAEDYHIKSLVQRKIPEGWKINYLTMSSIAFNNEGTVIEPGAITIQTKSNKYKVTCPLGKGRCYIVKQ
ncbi:competence type IV pilus minor pilin ComGD [Virgibacillus sp. JSM 102003]|uniref:competence type IV pilus minor pilin ComGD n=1 Tax=Virgibacillus sp. JSM 102003 TaxID=1562108 RepID=UPI0035C18B6A